VSAQVYENLYCSVLGSLDLRYLAVLISAGIELIFLPVAAGFWIQYEKSIDSTDVFNCC